MKGFVFILFFLICLVAVGALYFATTAAPIQAQAIGGTPSPMATPILTIAQVAPAVDHSQFDLLATKDAISRRDNETARTNLEVAQRMESQSAIELTRDIVALTRIPLDNQTISENNKARALEMTRQWVEPTIAVQNAKAQETIVQMPWIVGTQVVIQLGAGMIMIGLGGFLVYFLRQTWYGAASVPQAATGKATAQENQPDEADDAQAAQATFQGVPCPLRAAQLIEFAETYTMTGTLKRDLLAEHLPFSRFNNTQAAAANFLEWMDNTGKSAVMPGVGRVLTPDGEAWVDGWKAKAGIN